MNETFTGTDINRFFEADSEMWNRDFDGYTLTLTIRHDDQYAGYILDDGANDAPEVEDDYYGVCNFLGI